MCIGNAHDIYGRFGSFDHGIYALGYVTYYCLNTMLLSHRFFFF